MGLDNCLQMNYNRLAASEVGIGVRDLVVVLKVQFVDNYFSMA